MYSLCVRKAVSNDAERMAQILVGANRATFAGLVPEECLEFSVGESGRNWRKTLAENENSQEWLLSVAENEAGQVVGYGMWGEGSRHPDFASELKVLMVDPAWQRQGVGLHLVQHSAQFYRKRDINSMLVAILKLNPNAIFYERLGGRLVEERPYNWDGFEKIELLYGWDDLVLLVPKVLLGS